MSLKLGNTNIAGTQILYSTTGNNTDGAMTQAATTIALNNKADNSFVNLKANDADVVHKTGDETITGNKTFTGGVYLKPTTLLKQSAAIEGGMIFFEQPTSTSLTGPALIDIYGNLMRFVGKNSSNNYTTPLYLDLESGVAVATPSDAQNSVVTTTAISKGGNGYVKLGNGLIIQWGEIAVSTSNRYSSVITFPIPFSNTNYSLSLTQYTTTNTEIWSTPAVLMFGNKTTTGVTTQSQHTDRLQWIAIGY